MERGTRGKSEQGGWGEGGGGSTRLSSVVEFERDSESNG